MLRRVVVFLSICAALVAVLPGVASAQQAVLYELVENLDTVKLATTGHRVSHWTANVDNVVDAPEGATFSGQITGDIVIVQPNGAPLVQPELGKKKALLGPALPLIYIVNGKFFPDASPTIRTSPPASLPSSGETAAFTSTFRLPFAVVKSGKRATPERGKNAYYLGDNGSLITVDKQNEFALGFPLLRGEVHF